MGNRFLIATNSTVYETGGANSEGRFTFTIDELITRFANYTDYFEFFGFFISLCGIIFNYFVYSIAAFWPNSTSNLIWMKFLSLSDALALLFCGVLGMGLDFFGFYAMYPNSFVCKILSLETFAWGLDANIHVVALAVDRALILYFPLWHSLKSWKCIIPVLSFIWGVVYHIFAVPIWFMYDVENGVCTRKPVTADWMKWFNLSVSVLYVVGNLVPLTVANAGCVWKILKYRREKKDIALEMNERPKAQDEHGA